MRRNKFLLYVLSAVILAGLASCGHKIQPGSSGVNRTVVTDVDTATAQSGEIPRLYEASGQIESRNSAIIAAKVMGAITSVRVERGQTVRKGQILLTIDDSDLRQKADQAKQALAGAQKAAAMAKENATLSGTTYNRYKKLYDEKALSGQEFDEISAKNSVARLQLEQANAGVAQARAAVREAEAYLGYSVLRSPMNGIVVDRKADAGSMANPGMPLVQVEEPAYRLAIPLDERFLGKIKVNSTIGFVSPVTGQKETVKLTQVVPAIDPATRTFMVKAELPNGAGSRPASEYAGLRSGLYVRCFVPDGTKEAVTVPSQAVRNRGQLQFVYVIGKDGLIEFRAVRTGGQYNGMDEIVSGVSAGEVIAVSGFDRISEGMVLKTRKVTAGNEGASK